MCSPSPKEQFPRSLGRLSQGHFLSRLPPGITGTWTVGLDDISNTIVICISSVKPVPWLAVNLHHVLSKGGAFNTQSRSSLTSYVISRSISKVIHLRLWTWYCIDCLEAAADVFGSGAYAGGLGARAGRGSVAGRQVGRLSLLQCNRELQGHVAKEAGLGHRDLEEPNFVGVPYVDQTQPKLALLDHKCGHRMTQSTRGDIHRLEREISSRFGALSELSECDHPRAALVWRTCSNAVAFKAEEASPQATVLIARQTRRVPTGLGGEARFAPPGGGSTRTQLHRNRSLHLRDPRIPLAVPPSRVVR